MRLLRFSPVVALALVATGGLAWAKGAPAKPPVKPPVKATVALAWVSGTVEDEEKKPIAGAEAIVIQAEPQGKWKAVTDAKGMFTVKGVPAGEVTVVIRARSRIPVEQKVTVPDKGLVTANATLKLGVRFSGKVSDERAAPLAGAKIEPVLIDAKEKESEPTMSSLFQEKSVSGTDGTFVVDGLAPGSRYSLRFTHPHYKLVLLPGLPAEAGGGHDDLDVQMEDAAWVTGVVVDSSGKPVAGAEIGEASEDASPGPSGWNEFLRELMKAMTEDSAPTPAGKPAAPAALGKVTDAQGRFEFGGLDKTEMEIAVHADGYFPTKSKVEDLVFGKAKADVRITIELATAWIEGQVVDANGNPVPGATLSAHGDVDLAAEGKADATGKFRLNHVRSHTPVEIRGRADGFVESTAKDVPLNAAGAKVVMLLAPRLKVKVLDADGKIVPRVTVVTIGQGPTLRIEGAPVITIAGRPKKKDVDQPPEGLDLPLPTGEVEVHVTAQGFSEETVGKWTAEAGKTIEGGTVALKPQ